MRALRGGGSRGTVIGYCWPAGLAALASLSAPSARRVADRDERARRRACPPRLLPRSQVRDRDRRLSRGALLVSFLPQAGGSRWPEALGLLAGPGLLLMLGDATVRAPGAAIVAVAVVGYALAGRARCAARRLDLPDSCPPDLARSRPGARALRRAPKARAGSRRRRSPPRSVTAPPRGRRRAPRAASTRARRPRTSPSSSGWTASANGSPTCSSAGRPARASRPTATTASRQLRELPRAREALRRHIRPLLPDG